LDFNRVVWLFGFGFGFGFGHVMNLEFGFALEYERLMDIVVVMVASHLASRISHRASRISHLVLFVSSSHCHAGTVSDLFFRVSASAFVFDNVSDLGFFFLPLVEFKEGRSARAQR
jgi:hypothetical protein